MFFYTSIFVASVFMALIVLYLYRALVGAGKSVFGAILPSSKDNRTPTREESRYSTSINRTRTPWGWGSRSSLASAARPQPALPTRKTPWGWKGNGAEIRERGNNNNQPENAPGFDAFLKNNSSEFKSEAAQKSTVGWPYREEKSEIAGKAYKVKRQTTPNRTNLRTTGTPWGW